MKKIVSAFFISMAAVFCAAQISLHALAATVSETPNVSAKSAILLDYNTKTVIAKKDEDKQLPIASMTKIMTLLLCLEEIDGGTLQFDQTITVSKNASGMGGSQAFLEAGGEYAVKELIKSIVVASANDASVAMAETISGSEKSFVSKMNARAQELGMTKTNFVNCTGLPAPMHYSTAKDVATMLCALCSHPAYFEFSKIWLDEIQHPKGNKTTLTNTNKLVRFYEGCDGGKTGYTSEAGHCLAATATRAGMRLVAVVIAEPDSKTRFKDASDLFNFGFANFANKMILDSETPLDVTATVKGGKQKQVKIHAETNYYTFAGRNDKLDVRVDFVPNKSISAPIEKGDVVGTLQIYRDGTLIGEVNAVSGEAVNRRTYFDCVKDVLGKWHL